jgi:hypothetical protein
MKNTETIRDPSKTDLAMVIVTVSGSSEADAIIETTDHLK